MASSSSLEIFDSSFSDQQRIVLNDRMRRIQEGLDGAGGSSAIGSGASAASQLTLTVPGTLGILSDACPSISVPAQALVRSILCYLKQPPQGAPVVLQILKGGESWQQIVLDGTSKLVEISGGALVAANQQIRIDITQVGTTFPGADLTVMIRP